MNEKGMNKAKQAQGDAMMPTMLASNQAELDDIVRNYTIRYFKANIDEPSEVVQLQTIETKSLAGDEIVLTDRQTYSFEGNFFVVLRYLEKRP